MWADEGSRDLTYAVGSRGLKWARELKQSHLFDRREPTSDTRCTHAGWVYGHEERDDASTTNIVSENPIG